MDILTIFKALFDDLRVFLDISNDMGVNAHKTQSSRKINYNRIIVDCVSKA